MQARNAKWLLVAMVGLLAGGCATDRSMPTAEERQALAPTGKLRLCVLADADVQARREALTGELTGPAIDVGWALAQRLGVPFEMVACKTVAAGNGRVAEGDWDVISAAIDAEHLRTLDFSAPYAQIEIGVLAGRASYVVSMAEIDLPGVRIAVRELGGADGVLTPMLAQATLIRVSTTGGAIELLRLGIADAAAARTSSLIEASAEVPGSQLLEGRLAVQQVALGVPKGRQAAGGYVAQFVDELKASGYVSASIERARVPGLTAAP
jgi:polar amino acid transport system substrate-binding protein